MPASGVQQVDPQPGSTRSIEHVGNLVRPALFELGERAKVVVLSVTKDEDKPIKYPHMFPASQVVSNIGLLPHVRLDIGHGVAYAREVDPEIEVLQVSAQTDNGTAAWHDWPRHEHAHQPSLASA